MPSLAFCSLLQEINVTCPQKGSPLEIADRAKTACYSKRARYIYSNNRCFADNLGHPGQSRIAEWVANNISQFEPL